MIGVLNAAEISSESVFVHLFVSLYVPQSACIRRDLVCQDNLSVIETEFDFEVNQLEAFVKEELFERIVYDSCVLLYLFELFFSYQIECDSVWFTHERIAEVVVLV